MGQGTITRGAFDEGPTAPNAPGNSESGTGAQQMQQQRLGLPGTRLCHGRYARAGGCP